MLEYDAYLAAEPNDAADPGAGRNLMECGDLAAAAGHLNRVIESGRRTVAEPYKELAEAASRRGDWAASLALLTGRSPLNPMTSA